MRLDIDRYPLNNGAAPAEGLGKVQTGGNFFYLLQAPANCNVQLYKQGQVIGRAKNTPGGLEVDASEVGGFDAWAVQFSDGGNANVLVGISDVHIDLKNLTGNINVITLGGSGLQESVDVVSVAGVNLLSAANTGRRSVIVGSVHTNAGYGRIGNAPAANKGTELAPGQSITLDTQAAVSVFDAGGNTYTVQEVLA